MRDIYLKRRHALDASERKSFLTWSKIHTSANFSFKMRFFGMPFYVLFLCLFGSFASAEEAPTLSVSGIISENAVIQRNVSVPVFGTAPPNASVSINFAGQTKNTKSDHTGQWQVSLGPFNSGGPYVLTIESDHDEVVIQNLLIGDVIFCSGQSNMEFPVYRALNPDREIAGPHSDRLRLLDIQKSIALSPRSSFETKPMWTPASPDTVREFSAVCFFMGKALEAEREVPIGLIDASWGGSQIEAWLAEESLRLTGLHDRELDLLSIYRTNPSSANKQYGMIWEQWWEDATDSSPWADDDDRSDWRAFSGPMRDWNLYGDSLLKGYTGRVLFSREFELSAEQAKKDALLSLGVMDEKDITWVNGVLVGATDSWSDTRRYSVDAESLKKGQNLITIMVENGYGAGGMMGPEMDLFLQTEGLGKVDLAGSWRYKIAEAVGAAPSPPWSATSGYSTIYNSMIAPFTKYPLAGYIWYQGESNTNRGQQYEALMRSLVTQSRKQFGPDLPFVIVQLPGYGALSYEAAESGWSDVREAQRRVAFDDPLTGLAVTIDAGDRTDIHPANKQIVAERIARIFRGLNGDGEVITDGIAPSEITRVDQSVKVAFSSTDVRAVNAAHPIGFQLCNKANDCEWADARLAENSIYLTGKVIRKPISVRYCWGDAPICNLYGPDELPVVPFEMPIQ